MGGENEKTEGEISFYGFSFEVARLVNKGMVDVDLGYIAVHAEVIVLKKNRTKKES